MFEAGAAVAGFDPAALAGALSRLTDDDIAALTLAEAEAEAVTLAHGDQPPDAVRHPPRVQAPRGLAGGDGPAWHLHLDRTRGRTHTTWPLDRHGFIAA
ncbi:hypothetical protein [Nostocoides sp. HKS02]|uniref:hypothetical protein n=1 Tax=Nostocoides sp. HKS02 TaxID=1813880 RepID=UPI0012B49145|nr:hypothetical protein [Tetrasphaera sp. HKS02]QGN58285.1 hypothetical protein GKE56_10765 [Tetrasphaera sp. HKS02]